MIGGRTRIAYLVGEYYRTASLPPPPRLALREWGLFPFDSRGVIRHRMYRDIEDLRAELIRRPPSGLFHSTSYYEKPSERKMDDKIWLGADLIFDLDGDHLEGVDDLDFESMITHIQRETWRLWDTFLSAELGFDAKHVQVTFSGHRGFHIHVRDPELLTMDEKSRREVVEYIRGQELKPEVILHRSLRHNSLARPGWADRVSQGMRQVIELLCTYSESRGSKAKKELDQMLVTSAGTGLKPRPFKHVETLAERLKVVSIRKRVEQGNLKLLGGTKNQASRHEDTFLDLLKGSAMLIRGDAGEIDEVVTIDTKRLIRAVGSINGKAGFRVTELPLSRLDPDGVDPFDPLSEAIAISNDEEWDLIGIVPSAKVRLLEREISIHEGVKIAANTSEAAFLVLKRWALPLSEANP